MHLRLYRLRLYPNDIIIVPLNRLSLIVNQLVLWLFICTYVVRSKQRMGARLQFFFRRQELIEFPSGAILFDLPLHVTLSCVPLPFPRTQRIC